jgi:hypothetical protein
MIITIIIIYSLIIRGFKRLKTIDSEVRSDTSTHHVEEATRNNSSKRNSRGSGSLNVANTNRENTNSTSNLNKDFEECRRSFEKSEILCDCDIDADQVNETIDTKDVDNNEIDTFESDSIEEEGSLTDEEEFYNNVISTKAAAFQSKRNSSTSQSSSINTSSILSYEEWRSKRNSLRSQSSTASSDPYTDTPNSVINNRRLSEESNQSNRKWNYKSRRFGYRASLSKRRRTTGRYHTASLIHPYYSII